MSKKVATKDEPIEFHTYFEFYSKGLKVRNNPSIEICERYCEQLKVMNVAIQFAIGDLADYVESKFGDYSQLVDSFDYSVGYINNMKSTAKAFPPSRRRERVPFGYYRAIQPLPLKEQEKLLDAVESEEITQVAHMRNKVKKVQRELAGDKQEECNHNYVRMCTKCKEIML